MLLICEQSTCKRWRSELSVNLALRRRLKTVLQAMRLVLGYIVVLVCLGATLGNAATAQQLRSRVLYQVQGGA